LTLSKPVPRPAEPDSRLFALFMRTIPPVVDRLTRIVALYCGGILLFVLMTSIIVDVTGRYLFNHPLYGSLDMAITLLVLIVASSIAYGGRTGAHVTADIFSTLVGPWIEWVTAIFVKFFAAAIVAIWCWRLIVSGRTAGRLGETTLLLEIPFQPIYHALAFGIGLYALVLLIDGVIVTVKGDVPLLVDESRIVPSAIAPAPGEQTR
jgi:TRAP-type transport system small permease protein